MQKNVFNVVVLSPEAGDSDSQESNVEDVADSLEEIFKSAGELKVEEDFESNEESETALTSTRMKRFPKWKKSYNFDKTILIDDDFNILKDRILNLDGSSLFEIWRILFTEEMIEQIVCQTNLYGNRDKNNPNFFVTGEEIRKILGNLLISGYHSLPEENHYWSRQHDLGIAIVSNTMSRNRYYEIKKYLHFADHQNLTEGDKMSEIAPLYEMLNQNLIQFGIFNKLLSVDDFMVPYFGWHSAKIFIRGKPICFGFKIWCLCGSNVYPYNIKIYQGKEKSCKSCKEKSCKINL